MKEVIDWVLNQVLTQWIAIVTAIASLIIWKKDHSKLLVEPDNVAQPIAGILLDDGRTIRNEEHSMQHITMWLINTSANDIGFYDLRVALSQGEADYYTFAKFTYYNKLKGTRPEALIPFTEDGESSALLAIALPQANYGTVPAHGFVQLDLIFHADKPDDNGVVLMKLALPHSLMGRLRHSRFAPKWLHPKVGYVYSETEETARSFQVKEVRTLDRPD